MSLQVNRRKFIQNVGLGGIGWWVAGSSRGSESKSANSRLNIGVIGAGGRGQGNWSEVAKLGENIVALCDVDDLQAAKAFTRFPKAKRYRDFRKMLDDANSIDAVIVSTPDHVHAPASIMAMKLGKHVYCEKPLTHSVYEARLMRETATKYKVATQMGNMGTAGNKFRRALEVIQAGAIGPVTEVHVWTDRPGKYWVQNLERPSDSPPVPATLDWDLWIGPAPYRPYNPIYLPRFWRGWYDFGCGALGDMACHTANLPFMALKLGFPTSVEAETPGIKAESFPKWSIIHYQFPARGDSPPVKLTWYDGGKRPPSELFQGQIITSGGSLLIGAKGTMFSPGDYGSDFKLLPEDQFQNYQGPPRTIPRSPGGHHKEWILACKGGPAAMANFDYAALLTETVLLGNVAVRAGKKIDWDAEAMRVSNDSGLEHLIKREYRKGWTL